MSYVTEVSAILGMILGTAGCVLGLMNYFRDRPRVKLLLQWDMANWQTGTICGIARVTNVGRRPVFIGIVALQLPIKEFSSTHLVLHSAMPGFKLSEGDAPYNCEISYEALSPYSSGWRRIRAYAEDSTGKRYYSAFPSKNLGTPRWVTGTQ